MEVSELVQRVRTTGLYPIRIEERADISDRSELLFVGSLEAFFDAAKAFGATVILICTSKLEEEDFHYESDCHDDNDFPEDEENSNDAPQSSESFDLIVAQPSMVEFKKHIGEDHSFLLTAKSQLGELSFCVTEAWWNSFEQERDKAIEKIDEDREAIREKMEKRRRQKEEGLLKLARNLLNDPDFSRIPTQRGMKAYALEKHPELSELDDVIITMEIQKFSDKIRARKKR